MIIQRLELGEIGANCYIVTDEESKETAIIDAGDFTEDLKNALIDNEKKVKYILLTHGHFDHIWGVSKLQEFTKAPVAIHFEDAPCLVDENISLAYRHFPGEQKYIRPDVFLSDGDVLTLGETQVKVIHTPGHTRGSVCFLIEKNIFTGDTLFSLTVGRTDFLGGSFSQLMNSIDKLLSLEGEYDVFPGHNRTTTLNTERKKNRYIKNRHLFGEEV